MVLAFLPQPRGTGPQRRYCGAGMVCTMHGHGYLRAAHQACRVRRYRVKRGNLYPEQHQIGMRLALRHQGGSPKHAGRWLEHVSNGVPRGMVTCQPRLTYRIRPIGLPYFSRVGADLVRDCKDVLESFSALIIKRFHIDLQFLDFTTDFL